MEMDQDKAKTNHVKHESVKEYDDVDIKYKASEVDDEEPVLEDNSTEETQLTSEVEEEVIDEIPDTEETDEEDKS